MRDRNLDELAHRIIEGLEKPASIEEQAQGGRLGDRRGRCDHIKSKRKPRAAQIPPGFFAYTSEAAVSSRVPSGQANLSLSLGPQISLFQKEVAMCSTNIGDKLASQQIKEGAGKQAWWKEEIKFEIERLKAILRDPEATDEERAIAQSQMANYQEMSVMVTRPAAEWLQQMYLLAS